MLKIPLPVNVRPPTEEELCAIPVFPLPEVVFFPGTTLPLHLFEPRYRRMIEDCLTGDSELIAVALLEPGWEQDYDDRPPVRDVAGVGRIVAHESLPDGRHNVALYGLGRVALTELPSAGRPYRRATAQLLTDVGSPSRHDLTALMACASSVVSAVRQSHPEFSIDLDTSTPVGQMVDVLADRLVADVGRRQELLETQDIRERIRLVTEVASELMVALSDRPQRFEH